MTVSTLILLKEDSYDVTNFSDYYLEPLKKLGIPKTEVLYKPLIYNNPKKVTAKTGKAWLEKLLPTIPDTVTKIIVADSNYYKLIMKAQNVSALHGTRNPAKLAGWEQFTDVVYVPNYKSLFKQPENSELITLGLNALVSDQSDIVKSAAYAVAYGEDRELLDSLYVHDALTVDIETRGLKYDDEIVTIALAWDKHNGIAIDLRETGHHYVKKFLENYSGTLIMHNALFDAKLCIRNWWMDSETDYIGMQVGLGIFENVQDSMLTCYLAKNATTSVALDLKTNSLDFAGNYALDVTNINIHTQEKLLRYNLVDTLCTWYVWDKYTDQVETEAYTKIFQPSIKPLLKMMLVGLPLDQHQVSTVGTNLDAQEQVYQKQLAMNPVVQKFNKKLRVQAMEAANAKLKTRVRPLSDFDTVGFNPNSGPQKSRLFFDELKLPILEKTKNGNPSTDADTLENLKNHSKDPDVVDLIDAILGIVDTTKINGTFIKAFKLGGEFLHGNLKLGGTQSGRLSSNSPNLTNLPSQGKMGKLIKSCVVAPDGWLFAGADFASLEERIGAILSKDPNRIKVYTDGYDGHSLRAAKYFKDQMPDIVAQLDAAETATKFWIDENGEYCCGE